MITALFSLLLIFNAALPAPVSRVKDAALDQEFEVRLGHEVSIKREGLRVSFVAVTEDSRCPEGVQCIWAGNGQIMLRLSKAGKRAATLRLNTNQEPKQEVYRGFDVKLVGLNPYPKKNARIRKRDYVATLVVSRK
jgi:hypothetical protein